MPAIAEISEAGIPVEIGKIDRELKKLWEQASGSATRASLVNLAIYSEKEDSLARNTKLISQITESHACRALVISADRAAKENHVAAWISAHCHVGRAGSKQICSEQLSFALEGPCVRLLPSLVFSHLDSDLPFYLWWQDEFHDPMDPQLWSWVDRLIFDSHSWADFETQWRLVETAQAEAKQRVVLCDLNWTRLIHVRLALAQFFDHPAMHSHLEKITTLKIDHARGYRSTALLLVGWLAAQLQWKIDGKATENLKLADSSGKKIAVRLRETDGHPVTACVLRCKDGSEFRVAQDANADLLEVSSGLPNERKLQQLMPAGSNDEVVLISEELMRGGPHRVYLRAVNCIRKLA